jgi:AraC-like DNA-binding protein
MIYRLDLYAVFIFLGIVQAVFLCFFFFSKENRKLEHNVWHGLWLFSMMACILEIFLMYTGYIINCLYLVDFSEVFALAIGPCFYLLVISTIRNTISRYDYLHFLFPAVFFLMQLPFLLQPEDVKYNAWVNDYSFPLPLREISNDFYPPFYFLTDYHTELTLISLIGYGIWGMLKIYRTFNAKQESFFFTTHPVLKSLRYYFFMTVSSTVFILVIKFLNPHDTGDHIFAAYIALLIYMTSFQVIRSSGFFKQASLPDSARYKSSTVSEETKQHILDKLHRKLKEEKLHLQPDFSLPELAKETGTTVHILSQVINEGLKKSFFELLAEYRIEEAKRLLLENSSYKIEEIAERVGYNSKSSFNTSFKKITGKTPSEFRKSNGVDIKR